VRSRVLGAGGGRFGEAGASGGRARSASCRRRGSRSFTLVELVAVMVVVSIAFMPLGFAVGDAVGRQAGTNQRIVARWLTQGRIEEILADRHSATRGYSAVVTGSYTTGGVSGFPGFTRAVTISEFNHTLSAAGTGYKVVSVTTSWTEPVRGATSFQLQTVITDY
jgi:type II secretory pathway pseudopilin PulG